MKKLVVIALLSILLSACSGLPEDKAIETMVRDSILSDGRRQITASEDSKCCREQ